MSILSARGRAAATPVAEYVRMSTDLQTYSPENQSEAIAAFARAHGMCVVRRYFDEGRSGLDVGGREALQQLLADVRSGLAEFEAVLVYDVSRWGRFQDSDEAAYHEFICTKAGIRVYYVAEPFADDRSPWADLLKGMKRAMAAEYSRELSAKVFAGQCRLIQMGFRQGGAPGYGLRRMLISADGTPKGVLERGQRKSLATDRVILVPGPEHEVAVVRSIFREYCSGHRMASIASHLNSKGILTAGGRRWKRRHIEEVLTNEKYIGANVYGRTNAKLSRRRSKVRPEDWLRRRGAFTGIVSKAAFNLARKRIRSMSMSQSDEEMLQALRNLFVKAGTLSHSILLAEPGVCAAQTYARRFGSVRKAYELVGFDPCVNKERADGRIHVGRARSEVADRLCRALKAQGDSVDRKDHALIVNDALSIAVSAVYPRPYPDRHRWFIRPRLGRPDFVVFARLGSNDAVKDYVLWPYKLYLWLPRELSSRGAPWISNYELASLDVVVSALSGASNRQLNGISHPDDPREAGFWRLQRACLSRLPAILAAVGVIGHYPGPLEAKTVRPVLALLGRDCSDLCFSPQAVWDFVLTRSYLAYLLRQKDLASWLAMYHGDKLRVFEAMAEFTGEGDIPPPENDQIATANLSLVTDVSRSRL